MTKAVQIANVLVMRLLYVFPGGTATQQFNIIYLTVFDLFDLLRIFYAHQRGIYFLIEQPMTSVLALEV